MGISCKTTLNGLTNDGKKCNFKDLTKTTCNMFTWILSLSSIYFTGVTVSRYVKWRSWPAVRNIACVAVLNLFGLWYVLNEAYELPVLLGALAKVALGLCAIYFSGLIVSEYRRTRSWAAVRGKVNLALLAFVFLLVGGPFSPVETWGMFARVLWTGVSGLLFLLALWNMLWITFTKKDFPPFAPLATGIPLALYFCMLLFAYKEFF